MISVIQSGMLLSVNTGTETVLEFDEIDTEDGAVNYYARPFKNNQNRANIIRSFLGVMASGIDTDRPILTHIKDARHSAETTLIINGKIEIRAEPHKSIRVITIGKTKEL